MPREYEVGGTVYEFPDTFDDAKVKDILTRKGVIKPPKVAVPAAPAFQSPREALSVSGAREAKYGDIPRVVNPMSAMTLGLAAPAAIAAPIPTVVGMGSSALGNYIGLPEWMNVAVGLLAGGLAGGAQAIRRKLLSLSPAQRAEAEKVAIGMIPRGDKINKLRALLGSSPEAPTPFRPSPSVASKMRFGGPTEPELQTGKIIPRGKFMPPAETPAMPVKPFEPVRPNPNVARKMKFGGATDPYSGPSFKSPKVRYKAPVAEEMEIGESIDLGDVPTEYRGGVVETAKEIAKNRKIKVDKVADALRKKGVTPDVAEAATKDKAVRKLIAKEAGYKDISDITWDHIMRELKSGPSLTEPMPLSKFE